MRSWQSSASAATAWRSAPDCDEGLCQQRTHCCASTPALFTGAQSVARKQVRRKCAISCSCSPSPIHTRKHHMIASHANRMHMRRKASLEQQLAGIQGMHAFCKLLKIHTLWCMRHAQGHAHAAEASAEQQLAGARDKRDACLEAARRADALLARLMSDNL